MRKDTKPQTNWVHNWWIWGIIVVLLGNAIVFFLTHKNSSQQNHPSTSYEEQKRIEDNQETLDMMLQNPDLLYINELENQISKWADLFSELNETLQVKKTNVEEWEQSIYEVLFLMQMLIEESRTMSPTPSLSHIHQEYSGAIEHFEAMVTDLPTAIHQQDISKIEDCMEELEKGVLQLQQTREFISDYGNQDDDESEN
jgi:hypothetical protein